MSYDRADFISKVRAQREGQARSAIPQLRMMQAQGIVADKLLTDREHWNHYLSLCQARVDQVKARREDALRKIADPTVTDDEVRTLRIGILRADAMLDMAELLMSLPKAMFDDGQKAAELINQFERKDEPESPHS
jgi:hypothetical protein